MKKMLLFTPLILLILIMAVFGPRVRKDIKKKLNFENTYAIQNVETALNIRPFDATIYNDTPVIQYKHQNWECITWEFIKLDDNTFLLKNLFTEKTFQPKSAPKDGVEIWQKSLGGTKLQYWEFLKQPDNTYLIKLKDFNLYLTASSKEINSAIVLKPLQNINAQKWKLIKQNPWI